jgi:hypothetical protein
VVTTSHLFELVQHGIHRRALVVWIATQLTRQEIPAILAISRGENLAEDELPAILGIEG